MIICLSSISNTIKTSLTTEDLGRLPLETIAILSLFESYGYLNFSNQTLPSTFLTLAQSFNLIWALPLALALTMALILAQTLTLALT